MGDAPVTVVNTGRSFADKSVEELEAILDNLEPGQDVPTEEVPADDPAAPETPTPPEPPPAEDTPEPAPEEPPPAEPDLDALAREGEKIAREKLEAQLELLTAHNSRLAGKLGFLEQKLKAVPVASEPYEPQSQQELDRLALLEQKLEQSESRRIQTEVSQAIAESIGKLDGAWVQELKDEIAQVAPKYADQIKAAQESNEPELARQIATAVATVVKAEASQLAWQKRHETLVAQKQAATADLTKAKKAQTPAGSGGVPQPPPKPKTFADMTAAEADAWLRENVR